MVVRPDRFATFLKFLVALAVLAPAAFAPSHCALAEDAPELRMPGMPPVPLPPGAHVYGPGMGGDRDDFDRMFEKPRRRGADVPSTVIGPGGVVKPLPRPGDLAKKPPPKKVLTPQERAAQIRKALAPKPPMEFVRRKTLDELFGKLTAARDADEAKGVASVIQGIWARSGSDTANLLMQRAQQAAVKRNLKVALDLLDRVVALKPGWAEAWNQRASIRFAQGNVDGSMSDVERVLKLEPKHFGALDGMGAILQRTGFDRRALEVYRRSLSIYPHQPEIEKIVEKLQLEVEGQGI